MPNLYFRIITPVFFSHMIFQKSLLYAGFLLKKHSINAFINDI